MNIYINELKKPKIEYVKMNCDKCIDERLTKYEMIEDCFSKTSFNVIVGKMGQGKTSLVVSLCKTVFRKCFEYIYVFIPEGSRRSIEDDIFGKNLPEEQLYSNLSEEGLNEVYELIKKNAEEGYHSLLIIDDFQAQLKEKPILKVLEKIITKMRHLKTSIFLLQQNFQKLEKSLRELTTNLILFNVGKSQLEKVFIEILSMKRDLFNDILKIAYKDSHDWICINFRSNRIYSKFDEIIIY